jgi:TPP-dependent pyruvate/acetoin dehydrogenase alpha subunit
MARQPVRRARTNGTKSEAKSATRSATKGATKSTAESTTRGTAKRPANTAAKSPAKSSKKGRARSPARRTAKSRSAAETGTRSATSGPSDRVLQELHLRMARIRKFEEAAGGLMEDGKIPGALHLYVGQEAVASGIMQHLSDEDQITSTHRGHGHLIAKGGAFPEMFAELFGKASGYCKGKGGSMHISNMSLGMLGANGIVGGGPPIAMGAAFSNKFRGTDRVAVCFFGDGASNEGSFHEAANMASLYKLPCIFVCENNGYGEYTAQENHQAIRDVADRAAGYGMPGVVVDGMDVMAVYEAAGEAIDRARRGDGPSLLEAKTYRFFDHVGMRGMGLTYRSDEELEAWRRKDALLSFEAMLLDMGVMTKRKLTSFYKKLDEELAAAIQFAEASPFPDPSELLEDVYSVA